MSEQRFTLAVGAEYIPLDKLLKACNVVGSGGEAHAVIPEGLVRVNAQVELQKRRKIRPGDRVVFMQTEIVVDAAPAAEA